MDRVNQIHEFIKYTQVSRETIISLKKYENLLIKHNRNLNLVGNSTIHHIWYRHFLDSAQAIDLIDKNEKNLIDIGSGAGFPGVIIGILAKERKIPLKISLIEKSPKKSAFLGEVIKILKLNVRVINKNLFQMQTKMEGDVLIARAFKPLPIILKLLLQKTQNWKKIILFLGKTGKNELLHASKNWHIKYKQRMSVTSSDSLIITIKKIRKK